MGSVYLGEHPLIGKRVAVKVLHEELSSKEDIVSRFFNEAQGGQRHRPPEHRRHRRLRQDQGRVGRDIVYFIMEFLDGESLAARLSRDRPRRSARRMHVIAAVRARRSRPSHDKGIVHRDLKPENIYPDARAAATRTSSSCSTSASPSSPATARQSRQDAHRPRHRHAGVHVPGAVRGQGHHRPPHRHLLARHRASTRC